MTFKDQNIFREVKQEKNLAMLAINYVKAFAMLPQPWIIEALTILDFHTSINIITKVREN